jgi:hypothetical protein
MRPVDKVLECAANARKASGGWLVSCPLPAHGKGRGDKNPSVSVTEGDDGRVLVRCKVGCETEAVVSAWSLTMADLFESTNGHGKKSSSIPRKQLQPYNRATSRTMQKPRVCWSSFYRNKVSGTRSTRDGRRCASPIGV